VRFPDKDWKSTLDQWIAGHHTEIDKILLGYRVPLLRASTPKVSNEQAVRK